MTHNPTPPLEVFEESWATMSLEDLEKERQGIQDALDSFYRLFNHMSKKNLDTTHIQGHIKDWEALHSRIQMYLPPAPFSQSTDN